MKFTQIMASASSNSSHLYALGEDGCVYSWIQPYDRKGYWLKLSDEIQTEYKE